jgi:hypothetical protein
LLPWIARYYFTPIHSAANLFFPKNLLDKIKKNKVENFETKSDYNYSFDQNIILSQAQESAYNNIITSDNKKILLY